MQTSFSMLTEVKPFKFLFMKQKENVEFSFCKFKKKIN